jgi:hypothetical protein
VQSDRRDHLEGREIGLVESAVTTEKHARLLLGVGADHEVWQDSLARSSGISIVAPCSSCGEASRAADLFDLRGDMREQSIQLLLDREVGCQLSINDLAYDEALSGGLRLDQSQRTIDEVGIGV